MPGAEKNLPGPLTFLKDFCCFSRQALTRLIHKGLQRPSPDRRSFRQGAHRTFRTAPSRKISAPPFNFNKPKSQISV